MSEHSPGPWFVTGPWFVEGGSQGYLEVDSDDGLTVCTIDTDEFFAPENARLIAEAPAMLSELRKVEAYLAEQFRGQPIAPPAILESVRAAIARAEGR